MEQKKTVDQQNARLSAKHPVKSDVVTGKKNNLWFSGKLKIATDAPPLPVESLRGLLLDQAKSMAEAQGLPANIISRVDVRESIEGAFAFSVFLHDKHSSVRIPKFPKPPIPPPFGASFAGLKLQFEEFV